MSYLLIEEYARKLNEERQKQHEDREARISGFLSRLDWTSEQMERYQSSVGAFVERYRRVVAKYPKAPRLFR